MKETLSKYCKEQFVISPFISDFQLFLIKYSQHDFHIISHLTEGVICLSVSSSLKCFVPYGRLKKQNKSVNIVFCAFTKEQWILMFYELILRQIKGSRDGAVVRALHSPPTNESRFRFPDPASYAGWVCCWFSSLFREVFLRYSCFSPSSKTNTSKFQFYLGKVPPISAKAHSNKGYLFIYFTYLFLSITAWVYPSCD